MKRPKKERPLLQCLFCGLRAAWWVFVEDINCQCGAFAWLEHEGYINEKT